MTTVNDPLGQGIGAGEDDAAGVGELRGRSEAHVRGLLERLLRRTQV